MPSLIEILKAVAAVDWNCEELKLYPVTGSALADAFLAYQQSEDGHKIVEDALAEAGVDWDDDDQVDAWAQVNLGISGQKFMNELDHFQATKYVKQLQLSDERIAARVRRTETAMAISKPTPVQPQSVLGRRVPDGTRRVGRSQAIPTNGLLLRQLRKEAGLTQQALAEECGVQVSTIGRAESGRVSKDYLMVIARGLRKVLGRQIDLTDLTKKAEKAES